MNIVDRMKAYYTEHPNAAEHLPPPASLAVVVAAETKLGFALPSELRELYLSLANGGFGPNIIGLEGGLADTMGMYLPELCRLDNSEDSRQVWPSRLLPFAEDGCGSFSCADCSKPETPVIGFDPNVYNPDEGTLWSDVFFAEKASLAEWFEDWLEYPY